jgi:seryl-tRNA synthetase
MLDIKLIRDQIELVRQGTADKGYDVKIVDLAAQLDKKHRKLMTQVENLRAKRNQLTKDQIEAGKQLKIQLKELEPRLEETEKLLNEALNKIPNPPSSLAPKGKSDKDNVEVSKWGKINKFDFTPKDHLEIGTNLGILDFESGAKVSGSQFYYLVGDAALLEIALVRFAFDLLSKEGFVPVVTPDLAKSRYYLGTGYAPKGNEAQTYTIEGEDLGLVATAEVTLAGRHADEVLAEDQLPIKYIGYSHCFRQEAGAYGKYSKGLYRVHQFTKAEMFIYCLPEESEKYHQLMLAMEEKIYQALNIPYRILEMCTGDLGSMAVRKYDVEAWLPGRGDYGEITSTSNCTDYQARNLNIRYKKKSGETGFVHMLNGTAIATSRGIIAILENYQNADGSVTIPEVLRPYMGKDKIESKR